ncbi:MAG: MinD/ParA family protein [Syntrophomonadaceae bacterium]|nr:MinD/ParA family protein [Syntrophomonadaceae bacterium]
MRKIKLILADHNERSRNTIKELIELDDSMDIVAEAVNGAEVIDQIKNMDPQVVIMDLNLPEIDGLETTRYITLHYPRVSVIIISLNDEIDSIKRAMLAGAREYLVKPVSPLEIHRAVRQVAELGSKLPAGNPENDQPRKQVGSAHQIISIFGTKGGVGKSVICTNLAVTAAREYRSRVGLVDLDIQFGDISIMLNLNPRKTLAELAQEIDEPKVDLLEQYLYERNGVQILAAPNKPELAELVTPMHVKNVLALSRQVFDYTFVDTPSFIDDTTLVALESSDLILLVITLELPAIKNIKKGIEILRSLQLLDRARLVLNRSTGVAGIEPEDVERVLGLRIRAEVPSDGKLVVNSINQGIPFVKMSPRAPISRGILSVMKAVDEG